MIDTDLIACVCGHLRDQHEGGLIAACTVCGDDDGGCPDYMRDPDDEARMKVEAVAEVTTSRLTLADAEQLLGEPADKWAGRCFEIATALHQTAGLPGRVVYGHFVGRPTPDSYFADRAYVGFVQHGWIDLGDGTVIDPTRWAFEGVPPYLYEGPDDDYDEGGNRLRAAHERPCPASGDNPVEATLAVTGAAAEFVTAEVGSLSLTRAQVFWLANLSLPRLGAHAGAVYAALNQAGFTALIPFDNRRKVGAAA